jgi:hypothetical protein
MPAQRISDHVVLASVPEALRRWLPAVSAGYAAAEHDLDPRRGSLLVRNAWAANAAGRT